MRCGYVEPGEVFRFGGVFGDVAGKAGVEVVGEAQGDGV